MTGPICDFCSSPAVHWSYPARDFVADASGVLMSEGSWAACHVCHALIEEDSRSALVERTVASGGPFFAQESARCFVRRLHDRFFSNRTGPAQLAARA